MISCPIKVFAAALLMLPALVRADFLEERIGQTGGTTSLLIQPPVAFLTREQTMVMIPSDYDSARLGFSMSYSSDTNAMAGQPFASRDQERLYSATAVGEYAISHRIGVFGKFGLRYSTGDELSSLSPMGVTGQLQQLDHRYGVGMNVRASEVLSLHFEWERYTQGSDGTVGNLSNSGWDPWRERNVFGAGVRLGF